MFQPVPPNPSFPQLEEETLRFWRERGIYEQSLANRAEAPRFVFYEGPPTANGLPHPGHCLTRAIKDLFPRYRTMRGYRCERKAGWDTHGLPVEVEVCKELGIHSKEEIEAYGVEPFIHKCQDSVWRYMQQWERLTERLGFWIHLDEAYVTYHQSYVESVWWSLKHLFDRDLLYQGHKIVWWWAQGGTALSSGEVGQGYREVADPSVYVRFPLLDRENTSLLVWTTTPWTLPSNQFAAVHPDLDYATVIDPEDGQRLVLAADLVEAIGGKVKRELEVVSRCLGSELLGLRYRPPFDYYYRESGERQGRLLDGGQQHLAWRVVAAPFVTTDSGTGVVHQAPAFGEVDYEVLLEEQARFAPGQGPELICAVGPDGKFTAEAPGYEGRWVKEADKDISRELRERGVLFLLDQYLHEYPFCWRAEQDPLIQYPRRSWFIRTTRFRERMLENNRQINWLPEHIRDGRFGNFLETNVDWALSRERFWGTPLPIWVCSETGQMEAVGSYAELLAKPGVEGTEAWEAARAANPDLPEDLKVHKPYIDAVSYASPFAPAGRMWRVPEVIDCWYDSGAMPFAQWGYPHTGQQQFAAQFPADFISEAIDQTRGWFYSQLAISTMLFGPPPSEDGDSAAASDGPPHAFPHPFRNCIVLGLMLGEDGQKMSKSKRNYREPQEIFDRYGADALRWYFFANQAPWTPIRYKEQAIKESIPEFLLTFWNVFHFFNSYARIDGFDPAARLAGEVRQLAPETLAQAAGYRPIADRPEIDRWLMSELNRCLAEVVRRMDAYDNFGACERIIDFVDGLSNWYVRRNRQRFWGGDQGALSDLARDADQQDKLDVYWTLYECLLTSCKMIAPFTPFLAETLWQNLSGPFGTRAAGSVHLCDYPAGKPAAVDALLSDQMALLREIASRGRRARTDAKLKVRQPLQKVDVILGSMARHREWLQAHADLLREELNVKQVEFPTEAAQYISWQLIPNFKRLGPKVGKLMPAVKKALQDARVEALVEQLDTNGELQLDVGGQQVVLDGEDIEKRLQARPGYSAVGREKSGSDCVVALATELTPELLAEGKARDVVRLIQERRKTLDLERTDRVQVGLDTGSESLRQAVETHRQYIQDETLAVEIAFQALSDTAGVEHEVAGDSLCLYVQRSQPAPDEAGQ